MIIDWNENANVRFEGNAFASDIDAFIKGCPSLQYSAADFDGKNWKDFLRGIGKSITSGGFMPIAKSSMLLFGVVSHVMKRMGGRKYAAVPTFLQNCAAIYSIGTEISNHIKFQWTQRDYIYLCAAKSSNREIRYDVERFIRNKDKCHATQFCGVSFIECNALIKFVNEGEPYTFFSSIDHKHHTITPLMTNVESVNLASADDDDAKNGVPVQNCILKAGYQDASAAVVSWRYDDIDVVMTNSFARTQYMNNCTGNRISETWESLLVVANDSDTMLTQKVTDKLIEFISSLFAKYLDTKQYVYKMTEDSNSVVAELRPAILPPKAIDKSVEKLYHDMKVIFEKGVSRSYAFVGYPGTGKTIITQQLSAHFDDVCTFRLDTELVNDTNAMAGLMNYVKSVKKCIIIIDDFESADMSEKNETIKSLISLFDTLNFAVKNDGVSFVFLTTINDPSKINSTIVRRSGRIDEIVEIGYPGEEVMNYLLEYNDVSLNGEKTVDFSKPEFDDVKKTLAAAHLSAADIANLMTDVIISSNGETVTPQMLMDAMRRIEFRNVASTKNYLNPDENPLDDE